MNITILPYYTINLQSLVLKRRLTYLILLRPNYILFSKVYLQKHEYLLIYLISQNLK